ncbi:MAG: hypothetical protein ABFS28_07445 [Bacteroidota bacterium]
MNRVPSLIKAKPVLIGFLTLVVILASFFHLPVQIVDALSAEPVPGFDIHISAWRILFEPFTGPLLFYLRADQPVDEFFILLIWILAVYLISTVLIEASRGKLRGTFSPVQILNSLLTWLKMTPMIAVSWLGLLWLIIYIPLPANRIENHREYAILINTHSHTEFSHDGIISTKALRKWHKKNGFDAFFISDHNHHQKTLETVKAQEEGSFPQDPLILGGEEYSGSNHMTLLGLDRDFSTGELSDQQVIDTTHAGDGIVIVAHWFDDENKSIPFFTNMGVDGFEIVNQASGLSYDRRVFRNIVNTCDSLGLLMTGAADYHGYGSSCFVWNALEIPGWHNMSLKQKRESIMDILRQKDMSRIRVLIYHDRNTFERSMIALSPVYNFVNYFRTLNIWQLLSWFLWILLINMLARNKHKIQKSRLSWHHIKAIQIMATISSLFLLSNGVLLWVKARRLTAYNEIYSEYSTLLLVLGAGFLAYTSVFLWLSVKRIRSEKK